MDKKKFPPNDGKDVKIPETHVIHGICGSTAKVIKMDSIMKEPIRLEPKRNNRWTIKFKEPYKEIPQWVLKKTHRPKLINGSWDNIELILRDNIGPSTAQILVDGFRHNWQKDRIKVPVIKYSLEMLDPTGVTIEKWDVTGKIIEADFGELDYSEDILSEIKLIIEPHEVILVY